MKTYNYILFDWDGCLVKTLDIWLGAYKEVFAKYGMYPDDKVITQQVFGDWQGPAKLGITSMDEYNRLLLAKVSRGYTTLKMYDNALKILQELKKRNKKLALVTTSRRSLLIPALNRLGLSSMFDSILTAEDVTKHKPDPEVIHKTLTNLGAGKTESIFIGDTKEDVRGAQNAGIDAVLFYPKHNQAFYESKVILSSHPTYIIDDFRKLLDIIV